MVLSIDSGETSRPPHLSGSLTSTEDVEGGYSSSESSSSGKSKDSKIVAKSVSAGKYTRRRSQGASLRQRSLTGKDTMFCFDGEYSCYKGQPKDIPGRPKFRSLSMNFKNGTSRQGSDASLNLPQTIQFSSDDCTSQSCRSPKSFAFSLFVSFFLMAGGITYYAAQARIGSLQEELSQANIARRELQEAHSNVIQELIGANKSLNGMKHTHEKMNKVNHQMGEHIKKMQEEWLQGSEQHETSLAKLKDVEARADRAQYRFDNMVKSIQSRSQEQAEKRFGPGPHFVQLDVQLPSSSQLRTLKIKLAPLSVMPHAVHTFLTQVAQKAWDGTHFDVHAGHVLVARPTKATRAQDAQQQNNIPSVIFPEYSRDYPHDKYTLAFPGRPGSGQDFYINLQDNTRHHSPRVISDGTQAEGEPCFGTVVEGKEVVDEMDLLPVGQDGILEQSVTIVQAKLLHS